MSSKRKSPPSKLQEGSGDGTTGTDHAQEASTAPMEAVAASPLAYYGMPEAEARRTPPQEAAAPTSLFYKLSSASSSSAASGSEVEDLSPEDELLRSPPNKRKKDDFENRSENADECGRYYQMNCLPKPDSLQALLALNQSGFLEERPPRRRRSGCESPSEADKKALLHLNNNSTTLNHNSAVSGGKRTMDDVLKRLTNKMNNSTLRDPSSPTKPQSVHP